jgi:hypothetical protein
MHMNTEVAVDVEVVKDTDTITAMEAVVKITNFLNDF